MSDYTFRGISQTEQKIAVQGGIELDGPKGLYLGTWGSSLNFGEPDGVVRAEAETDVVGGIRPSAAGLDFDLGFVFYGYPGTKPTYNYDFLELGAGVSRSFSALTTGVKAAYSSDYFGASGSSLYVNWSLGLAIPNSHVSLAAAVGHQSISDNAAFGTPNYVDWSVGATVAVGGLTFGVSGVGTNLSQADCFGGSELCKSRLVLSVSH